MPNVPFNDRNTDGLIEALTPSANDKRIAMERDIVKRVMESIIKAGFDVRIHDGEAWAGTPSSFIDQLMTEIWSTDEETIYCYDRATGKKTGAWVSIIYGNEQDVIHDYTESLETIMAPVLAYCNTL